MERSTQKNLAFPNLVGKGQIHHYRKNKQNPKQIFFSGKQRNQFSKVSLLFHILKQKPILTTPMTKLSVDLFLILQKKTIQLHQEQIHQKLKLTFFFLKKKQNCTFPFYLFPQYQELHIFSQQLSYFQMLICFVLTKKKIIAFVFMKINFSIQNLNAQKMNFQIFLVLLYFLLQSLATFFVISQTHEATLYTILFVLVGASYMFTICRNSGYVNRKEPIDSIIEEGEVSEFPSEPSNIQNPTHRNIHHHEEQRVELHQKCRICHIKQPLRTKHCHECNRCVPTFDHHCPWLHTCIGEKNRPAFLMFLLFQEIQLIFIGKQLGVSLVEEGLMKVQVEKAMLTLLFIFGIIGFGSLLVFHLYLMGANLTTWEFVKWKTIIYLKNKEPKKVSPFSKGLLRNVSQYFAISFSKEPKNWQLELES